MSSPTPNRATRPDERPGAAARLAAVPDPPRPSWRERHPLVTVLGPDLAAGALMLGGSAAVIAALVATMGWWAAAVIGGVLACAAGQVIATRPGPAATRPDAPEVLDGRWPEPGARPGAPASPYSGT